MNVHEDIYQRLDSLLAKAGGIGGFLTGEKGYLKIENKPYMTLHVDRLGSDRLSMAHNYNQNGDVMADPDMEIRVNVDLKMAEALTFQQDGLGIYQVVYPEPGKVYPKLKQELNSFLRQWLKNIKAQGFEKKEIAA